MEKNNKDKWSDGNPTRRQVWEAVDKRHTYTPGSEMRKIANAVINNQYDTGYETVSAIQWEEAKFLAKDGNITK
jgi:hypothetical protein